MWGLVAGLLWATTFIMAPTHANGFWLPKDHLWLVGSFSLASTPFWNPPSQTTVSNRWLGFFLLYVLGLFAWLVCWPQMHVAGNDDLRAAIQLPWNVMPIFPVLTILGSVLALDAMTRHTDSLLRWHRVALHLVRIGSVVALIAIGQVCRLDPFGFVLGRTRISDHAAITVFGNPTLTGHLLAVCAPLALMFRSRRYRWGAFSLMVVAILLTQSASSLAAVLVASCWVWGHARKAGTLLVSLAALGIGMAWLFQTGQGSGFLALGGRSQMWQHLLTVWAGAPVSAWIGYGPGAIATLTARGLWNYGYAHTWVLQVLFDLGLLGLLLFCGAVGGTCWRVWRTPRTMSLVAWSGAALAYGLIATVSIVQIGTFLMLGCIIWAALEAHAQQGGANA